MLFSYLKTGSYDERIKFNYYLKNTVNNTSIRSSYTFNTISPAYLLLQWRM